MTEPRVALRTGGDLPLLRGLAEERLTDAGDPAPAGTEDPRWTGHELRLHQEELAMQGQELRRALADLEVLLARQMERYQAIPAGVVAVRFDGTVAEANAAACDCLGVGPEDLLEQPLSLRFQVEDRPAFAAFLAGHFLGGTPRSHVVRRLDLDPGGAGWIHLEGPGPLGGGPAYLSVIDVSPLLAREAAALARMERAASLLAAAFEPLFAVRQALRGGAEAPLEAVQRALTETWDLLSGPA